MVSVYCGILGGTHQTVPSSTNLRSKRFSSAACPSLNSKLPDEVPKYITCLGGGQQSRDVRMQATQVRAASTAVKEAPASNVASPASVTPQHVLTRIDGSRTRLQQMIARAQEALEVPTTTGYKASPVPKDLRGVPMDLVPPNRSPNTPTQSLWERYAGGSSAGLPAARETQADRWSNDQPFGSRQSRERAPRPQRMSFKPPKVIPRQPLPPLLPDEPHRAPTPASPRPAASWAGAPSPDTELWQQRGHGYESRERLGVGARPGRTDGRSVSRQTSPARQGEQQSWQQSGGADREGRAQLTARGPSPRGGVETTQLQRATAGTDRWDGVQRTAPVVQQRGRSSFRQLPSGYRRSSAVREAARRSASPRRGRSMGPQGLRAATGQDVDLRTANGSSRSWSADARQTTISQRTEVPSDTASDAQANHASNPAALHARNAGVAHAAQEQQSSALPAAAVMLHQVLEERKTWEVEEKPLLEQQASLYELQLELLTTQMNAIERMLEQGDEMYDEEIRTRRAALEATEQVLAQAEELARAKDEQTARLNSLLSQMQ